MVNNVSIPLCQKLAVNLKEKLKSYLDYGKETFNGTYFNEVLCYEDLNGEIIQKFSELSSRGLGIIKETRCKEGDCAKDFGLPSKILKPKKIISAISHIPKVKIAKKKRRRKIIFENKNCPDKPAMSDTIFERISKAYCLYGFPRLDIFEEIGN